jgi:hypothetical protein
MTGFFWVPLKKYTGCESRLKNGCPSCLSGSVMFEANEPVVMLDLASDSSFKVVANEESRALNVAAKAPCASSETEENTTAFLRDAS